MTQNMAKIYRRDSFDRFGDDLTQLILSYFPIEEKLLFECVCNRWQNHVFAKVLKYELSPFEGPMMWSNGRQFERAFRLDLTRIRSLMKKFIHLNDLLIDAYCECDDNVLQILIDLYDSSLKNLNKLHIRIKEDINYEVLTKFSQLYGQTLTNVSIEGLSEQRLGTVLSFFGQNLKSIDLRENLRSLLVSKDLNIFTKLKDVSLRDPSLKDFKVFVNKYGQQLKILSLKFDYDYKQNVEKTLKYVSNLRNLQVFELVFELSVRKENDSLSEQQLILESLQLIGRKCLRLYSVDICIVGNQISDGFLKIFGRTFICLENLSFKFLFVGNKPFQTINCFGFGFKNGSQLTKLNLSFAQLSDAHIKDIHLFLPNLRAIKLTSNEYLTTECLRHLSKLKNLMTVVLEGYNDLDFMKVDGIREFVGNCPTLNKLDIEFARHISEVDYNIFISMALMTPRINYFISYHCECIQNGWHQLIYVNSKNNLHVYQIPNNI